MSERELAAEKLKGILANLDTVLKNYDGAGYKKIKKEQLLKDFRQAVGESEALLKIFEDSYNEMPEEVTNIGATIYNYFSGLRAIATTVEINRKK